MSIRSQQYAQEAFLMIEAVKGSAIEAKYRTLALNFPSMILQSGLSQSTGFLLAKGKAEHIQLLNHLAQMIGGKGQTAETFHTTLLTADLQQYQILTRKAIDAASSLKRYTQALLSA